MKVCEFDGKKLLKFQTRDHEISFEPEFSQSSSAVVFVMAKVHFWFWLLLRHFVTWTVLSSKFPSRHRFECMWITCCRRWSYFQSWFPCIPWHPNITTGASPLSDTSQHMSPYFIRMSRCQLIAKNCVSCGFFRSSAQMYNPIRAFSPLLKVSIQYVGFATDWIAPDAKSGGSTGGYLSTRSGATSLMNQSNDLHWSFSLMAFCAAISPVSTLSYFPGDLW